MSGILVIAVVGAWLWFCVWLARKVASWMPIESRALKILIGLLAFGVLVPLPLIDEIIGKFQFDKLCREEAGVKIYGKLELGPEFFNPDGTTNLINRVGNLDEERIDQLIEIVHKPSVRVTGIANISKGGVKIISVSDQTLLLEQTDFGFNGGYLAHERQPWLSSTGCPAQVRDLGDLVKRIIDKQ